MTTRARATWGMLGLVVAACTYEPTTTLPTEDGAVPLRVTAVVVGVPIATLVVEVTAPDIAPPLVFNLTVVDGVASGTIRLPPGPGRLIRVTAMDAEGNLSHEGSATIDVRPGQNTPVQIRLTPRSGHVPITVTFGNFGVVVAPPSATIDITVAATLQLGVTVTDVNGQVISSPAVGWATTNPAVATVSGAGLVTGVVNGTAAIVATYEGVAGLSAVTVTGAGSGPTPSAEVCDGADNDLDGQTDEGLAYCVGGAAAPHTDGTSCLAGFQDANGNPADGCEQPGGGGSILAGELVISEIMVDPSRVGDERGEWFEVYNPTARVLELAGLTVRDDQGETFTVGASLLIPPGGYRVFGVVRDMATNGGALVDYAYSGMTLANTGDQIEIRSGSTLVDRVNFAASGFPPVTSGRALSLRSTYLDASVNDAGVNWCLATSAYGAGDLGTPGAPSSCN